MLDAIGHICWWGLTPSINLPSFCTHKSNEKVKILSIGASDIRNIMESMCQSDEEVEIYIIETNLEQYCRNLLLLSVILQPPSLMGLQEKTELYLDLFGNSLLRSHSSKFLKSIIKSLIRLVTDDDYLKDKLPFVDLSLLKFKERDFMEGIFKFWEGTSPFEMTKLWDSRVRRNLGNRYDCSRNAFDMDFNMKLRERAQLLDFNEYANWRQNGVAFDVRDGVFDIPNRTLCSGIINMVNGEKQLLRGYWGDIVTSPYIAHGVVTPLKSMYEVRNRINVRTSSEVSEYNVMCYIHQITTGEKYDRLPKPDRFTLAAKQQKEEEPKLTEITEEDEGDEETVDYTTSQVQAMSFSGGSNEKYKLEVVKPSCNVSIKFLPLGIVQQLSNKSQYQKQFDLIYFGVSQVSYFSPEITELLKDEANVLVENVKYIASLSKDQELQYLNKIKEYGLQAKCELLGSNDQSNNNFHFSFQRS